VIPSRSNTRPVIPCPAPHPQTLGSSVRPGLGFKRFRTAWRTLVGYETLAMMRKGQVKGVGGSDIVAQAAFVNALFGVAA
jgi:hypothetical protein